MSWRTCNPRKSVVCPFKIIACATCKCVDCNVYFLGVVEVVTQNADIIFVVLMSRTVHRSGNFSLVTWYMFFENRVQADFTELMF